MNYLYSKRDQVPFKPIRFLYNDTTISVDTQLTTTSGQYLPTFYYRNLTVNSGVTLTTSNSCKGLILVVTGTLTLNGTISMTARGFGSATLPSANPSIINSFALLGAMRYGIYEPHIIPEKPTIEDSPANAFFPIGSQISPVTPAGSNGSSGQGTLSCGGGGGSYYTATYQVSQGGLGYVFSGGSGACGAFENASWTAVAPVNYGLAGGYITFSSNNWLGGAGNPGSGGTASGITSIGQTGTGGLLIVVANLIQGTGKFVSKGSNGGASEAGASGGAGSGGGIVFVRCVTNNSFDSGTGIDTTGGLATTEGSSDGKNGGEGYKSFEVFV